MALDGGQQDNGGLFLPNGTQYMTQQLSTIPTAPSVNPDTAPVAGAGSDPAAPDAAIPPAPADPNGSGPASAAEDPDLEVSRNLEKIGKREARTRKAEVELHQRIAAHAEREKQLAQKLEELDAALSDPVGHMLKNGQNPVEVARRFSEPETEEQRDIRKLKAEIAADKADREAKAKDYENLRIANEKRETVRSFVQGINPTDHPHITALYEPQQIPTLVSNMLNRPLNRQDPESPTVLEHFVALHKREPTNEEIRESLESEAASRATKILKTHADREAAESASQAVAQTQASARAGAGPSGISNLHASVTSSGKARPPTLEEKRRLMRKELTEALEAEATERT
jgi:cell fate (sporulation/competence/biofilm development) regulator YlbF (YheA/YmcA/DUF963 family)